MFTGALIAWLGSPLDSDQYQRMFGIVLLDRSIRIDCAANAPHSSCFHETPSPWTHTATLVAFPSDAGGSTKMTMVICQMNSAAVFELLQTYIYILCHFIPPRSSRLRLASLPHQPLYSVCYPSLQNGDPSLPNLDGPPASLDLFHSFQPSSMAFIHRGQTQAQLVSALYRAIYDPLSDGTCYWLLLSEFKSCSLLSYALAWLSRRNLWANFGSSPSVTLPMVPFMSRMLCLHSLWRLTVPPCVGYPGHQ